MFTKQDSPLLSCSHAESNHVGPRLPFYQARLEVALKRYFFFLELTAQQARILSMTPGLCDYQRHSA